MGGRCGGGAGRAPRAPEPQRGRPAPPAPSPATQDLPGGPKCRWTKGARGASSSRGAGEGPPTATPAPGHASLSLQCGISSVAPGRSANAEGNKRVSVFDNGGLIGSRSSLQSLDCGYEAPSRTTAADLRRHPSVRCQARGRVTGVSCFLRVSFCPSQRRSQRVRISSPSEWPMPGTRLSLAAGPRLEHVTRHAVEITRTRMRARVGFPGSLRLCRGRSREWGISVMGPTEQGLTLGTDPETPTVLPLGTQCSGPSLVGRGKCLSGPSWAPRAGWALSRRCAVPVHRCGNRGSGR